MRFKSNSGLGRAVFLVACASLLFIDQIFPRHVAKAISDELAGVSDGYLDVGIEIPPIPIPREKPYHEKGEEKQEGERKDENKEAKENDEEDKGELEEGKPADEIRKERNKEIKNENDEIDEESEDLEGAEADRREEDKDDPKPKGYPSQPSATVDVSLEDLLYLHETGQLSDEALNLMLAQ